MREKMIPPDDHWYRSAHGQLGPCVFLRNGVACGESYYSHVQSVGEEGWFKHLFIPSLRHLRMCGVIRCRLCGGHRKHGCHFLTKAYRKRNGWRISR